MSRPLREVTIYLVIAFGIALGIATAIPHMGVNSLLSAFAPVTAVLIITFASTPRGKRRSCGAASASSARARSCGRSLCSCP